MSSSTAAAPQTPESNKDWLAEVATQLEAEAGNLPDEMQAVKAKLASSAAQLRTPEAAEIVKELDIKKKVNAVKESHGSTMEHMQRLKNNAEVANAKYKRHKSERDRIDAITKGKVHISIAQCPDRLDSELILQALNVVTLIFGDVIGIPGQF